MTTNFIDFQKLVPGYKFSDEQNINKNPTPFQWVPFEENSIAVPENSVTGCIDIDGSPLYVIRKKRGNSYLY
jgi:hypothetical protein